MLKRLRTPFSLCIFRDIKNVYHDSRQYVSKRFRERPTYPTIGSPLWLLVRRMMTRVQLQCRFYFYFFPNFCRRLNKLANLLKYARTERELQQLLQSYKLCFVRLEKSTLSNYIRCNPRTMILFNNNWSILFLNTLLKVSIEEDSSDLFELAAHCYNVSSPSFLCEKFCVCSQLSERSILCLLWS